MLFFASTPAVAHEAGDHEKDAPAVKYRVGVMMSQGGNAMAIGAMLQGKLPQTQNLARHAQGIAAGARNALSAFEPKVPGGHAKDKVWSEWKDFAARLNKLAADADALAAAAAQDPAKAMALVKPVFDSCSGCHDIYQTK